MVYCVIAIPVIASTANIAISDIALPTTSTLSTEVYLGKFLYRIIYLFYYLLIYTTIYIILL